MEYTVSYLDAVIKPITIDTFTRLLNVNFSYMAMENRFCELEYDLITGESVTEQQWVSKFVAIDNDEELKRPKHVRRDNDLYSIAVMVNKSGVRSTFHEMLAHFSKICNGNDSLGLLQKVTKLLDEDKQKEAKKVIFEWCCDAGTVKNTECKTQSTTEDGTVGTDVCGNASRFGEHIWLKNMTIKDHSHERILYALVSMSEQTNRFSESQWIAAMMFTFHLDTLVNFFQGNLSITSKFNIKQLQLLIKFAGPKSNLFNVLCNQVGMTPLQLFNNDPKIMEDDYILNNIQKKGHRSTKLHSRPLYRVIPINRRDCTVHAAYTRNKQRPTDLGTIFTRMTGMNHFLQHLQIYDPNKPPDFISIQRFLNDDNFTRLLLILYGAVPPDVSANDIIKQNYFGLK